MAGGVIKAENTSSFASGVLTITRLLDGQLPFGVSVVEIDGENRRVRNSICDAAYYVLQGNGRFSIDGKVAEVGSGDMVFLPRGTVYQDSGKMTMLSIYQPPFNPQQVEYLD